MSGCPQDPHEEIHSMAAEDICAKINALPERERMEAIALLIAISQSGNTENESHHYPWDEETPIDGSK